MDANTKKQIQVPDCVQPRPEYFLTSARGHLFGMALDRPGPFPTVEWKIWLQRHHRGELRFELLLFATFYAN